MKQSEPKPCSSNSETWRSRLESMSGFKIRNSQSWLDTSRIIVNSEVFALTTIHTFHSDTLEDYVYESNWLLLTREQIEEPSFQKHLVESDSLTSLCKSMSEKSIDIRRTEVVAKSPNCYCSHRSPEKSKAMSRRNTFRCFFDSLSRIWRGFKIRLKNCFSKTEPPTKTHTDCGQTNHITSFCVNDYLCR